MSERGTTSSDPDIIASVKALRRAARRALEIGLSTGTPVYVMKAGKIVDLTQEVSGHSARAARFTVREASALYKTAKARRRQK